MASHRLAAILKLTGRLSDEEIENISEEIAWQWLRSNTKVAYHVNEEIPHTTKASAGKREQM